MAPTRERWDGDPDELAGVLAKHMPFAGAIVYPEDKDPQLDKTKITREPLRSLLRDLSALQQNLSFTKCNVERALRQVEKNKNGDWTKLLAKTSWPGLRGGFETHAATRHKGR